ncbi:MAG: rod shape-determining protein MreC [Flavobacteriales bacterium]
MKNILALIRRFYLFLLFLGLQALALTMLFRNNRFHGSEFIRHSSDWAGGIYSQRAQLSEYLRLGEINDQLSLENALLRSTSQENFWRLRTEKDTLNDTTSFQRYIYRTAKVVNASVNREKNYITIDRGLLGEVGADMGVIAGGNMVGVVRSASEHFAVVMPIIHADFKASVRLRKSGAFGSLVWRGGDAQIADVIDIPKNIPVAPGDTIVSSGYSAFFPANIHVGTVEWIDDSDNDYHIIKVRMGADFRRLDHVLVISDIFKQEQDTLLNNVEQQDAANSKR